jgi:hypothetical protein
MTPIKLETTEAERAEWSAHARRHFASGVTHDDRLLDIERRLNRDFATLQAALSEAEGALIEAEASGYRKGRDDCERADVPVLLNERDILRVDLSVCRAIRADLERQLGDAKGRAADLETQLRTALSEAGKAGGEPVAEKAAPTNADLVRAFNAWTPPHTVAVPPQDGLRATLAEARVFIQAEAELREAFAGPHSDYERLPGELVARIDALLSAPGEGNGTADGDRIWNEAVEAAKARVRGWLALFGEHRPDHISAHQWATDAVKDILDAVDALRRPAATRQATGGER